MAVIALSVLDSQLPVLQLLLQVTRQRRGRLWFLERRVRPSSAFLQTHSSLAAEPTAVRGLPPRGGSG